MATTENSRPRNDLRAAEFAREKTPLIDPAEPEAIEEFLRGNGPCRRIATVFLSRLYRQSQSDVRDNRQFAVAMAAVFLALEDTRGTYFSLAALMESAYERIRAVLQSRPDFELILAEAKRQPDSVVSS